MKLLEIYVLKEFVVDADKLELALTELDKLLGDEKIKLLPMLVNPPVFPGDEEWAFYEDYVDPILKKNGWEMTDEHLPIVNTNHWKFSGQQHAGERGAMEDLESAISMLEPISGEAKQSSIVTLKQMCHDERNKITQVAKMFDDISAPIIVGVPGSELDPSSFSRKARDIWDKRLDDE
jgi:hypothetical protein